MSDTLALTLPADTAAMSAVVPAVEAFCEANDLPPRSAYVFGLVVEELVTNVVNHAYRGRRPGPVRLAARLADGAVSAEISDDGPAFDPLAAAPAPDTGAAIDDRPIGGLGVHIVRTLVEDIAYVREGEANVVRFRIPV